MLNHYLKFAPINVLKKWIQEEGEPEYRLKQIIEWLWKKNSTNPHEWTNLPVYLRKKLVQDFNIGALQVIKIEKSQSDSTTKVVFGLVDGLEIETVWIPEEKNKATVCVSTQVGCALNCTFCATGKMGLLRNLTGGEIAEQVVAISKLFPETPVRNVVFMGMGEPLMNLPGVYDALTILTSRYGLGLGARRITISTVGLPEKIIMLATQTGARPRLALSLHSAIQEKREKIMPIARIYKLDDLIPALQEYHNMHKRWLTFEYVLLPGFNDKKEDVEALVELSERVPAKVNIIPWNPVKGITTFRSPTQREVYRFATRLQKKYPYPVTIRKPRGREINAACGQLIIEDTKGKKITLAYQ